MRIRAIGYAGGMLLVPLAWRLRGRPQPYPRELDMAVTLPLLVDAGGTRSASTGARTSMT